MPKDVLVLLALLGSAACARAVRPDDMSAVAHRQEADRERVAAAEHIRRFDPDASAPVLRSPRDDLEEETADQIVPSNNPTAWHLWAAERHQAHAREHEAAARALEAFELAECREVPVGQRAACPFIGPIREVVSIEHGVRIVLMPGAPLFRIASAMRCQIAFARARAFAVPSCPLTVRGTEVRVTTDGAIELTSAERHGRDELTRRAQALREGGR